MHVHHDEVKAAMYASYDIMHSVPLNDALQAELNASVETHMTHVFEDAHNIARHLHTDVLSKYLKLAARMNAMTHRK